MADKYLTPEVLKYYDQSRGYLTQEDTDNLYLPLDGHITLTDEQKAELKGTDGKDGKDGIYQGIVKNIMTASDTSITLNPNEVYIFPTMASLNVTLGPSTSMYDEYTFIFTSGSTPTSLTIPSTIKLPKTFSIDPNTKYEISIADNALLIGEWPA